MAKRHKLIQQIFEARYERGYRYLDRCGDAMVVLEEGLPTVSKNKLWLPEETVPTGARMKCPELDMILVFDSGRLCLDQNPADVPCPFAQIVKYACDTVISKFDIKKIKRLGARQVYLVPTDSIDEADKLSVKKAPWQDWPLVPQQSMSVRKCEAKTVVESEDGSVGVNFSIKPVYKVGAPIHIDQRLTIPPHLLEKGQREALLAQLKRQKQREQDPVAGLAVDIDFWSVDPDEVNILTFLKTALDHINERLKAFWE